MYYKFRKADEFYLNLAHYSSHFFKLVYGLLPRIGFLYIGLYILRAESEPGRPGSET